MLTHTIDEYDITGKHVQQLCVRYESPKNEGDELKKVCNILCIRLYKNTNVAPNKSRWTLDGGLIHST